MVILDFLEEEKTITFDFSPDEKEFTNIYNSQINLASKNLKLSGFRKGFVPIDIAANFIDKKAVLERSCSKLLPKIYQEIKESKKDISEKILDCSIKNEVDSFDEKTKKLRLKITFEKLPDVVLGNYSEIKTFYCKKSMKDEDIFWFKEKNDKASSSDVVFVTLSAKDQDDNFLYQYFYDFLEIDLSNSKLDPKFLELIIDSKAGESKKLSLKEGDKDINFEINILSIKEKVKITKTLVEELKIPNISTEKQLIDLVREDMKIYLETSENKAVVRWILGSDNSLSFIPIESLRIKSLESFAKIMKKDKRINNANRDEIFKSILNENVNSFKLSLVLNKIASKEEIIVSDEVKSEFFRDVEKKPWLYKNRKVEDFFSQKEEELNQCIIHFKTISFLREKLLFSN